MKRHRQKLSELVTKLTPVDASWLDEHAENCIQLMQTIPLKNQYTPEDFTETLLREVFSSEQIQLRCRFTGSNGLSTEKADFAIPSRTDPCLLIEAKAYGATGSKQTDILGDLARIVEQKRNDTVMLLITDGITWRERLSDLEKLVEIQNRGLIHRIYTRSMKDEFLYDLSQIKDEFGL